MSSFNTWGPHLAMVAAALLAWRFLKIAGFARLAVGATLVLIFLGGMVTSKNAGLAVPDWPLSFGTINPDGWWKIQNVMLEHGHRLFAQFVGLFTTILMVRIFRQEKRASMRAAGVCAFFGVVAQGVLGGLRVTHTSTTLAMIHACTAQAFLCLLIFIAVSLAPRWRAGDWNFDGKNLGAIRVASWLLVVAIYCQLILGAVMRHHKAALAFGNEFPLVDGALVPPLDSPDKIIHFSHRVGALCVTLIALTLIFFILAKAARVQRLAWPAGWLAVLLATQISLGAHIVWLAQAGAGGLPVVPPVTTSLHVVCGAALLGTSLLIAMRASRFVSEIPNSREFAAESIFST